MRAIENYDPAYNPYDYTIDRHPTINVLTEYEYDALGNRLEINHEGAVVAEFSYDDLGRLISETDGLSNSWHYTYTVSGQRVELNDANGETISFEYNGLGV